jgi:predicted LPLAT superfamily acyltransferase
MRHGQYYELISIWSDVKDRLECYKMMMRNMLDFAKYHKTQMACLISAYLRDIEEVIKRIKLYKPYQYFNYYQYYVHMRNLLSDAAQMRKTVDFVMSQFPNFPNYP